MVDKLDESVELSIFDFVLSDEPDEFFAPLELFELFELVFEEVELTVILAEEHSPMSTEFISESTQSQTVKSR
jgi:hypothetical protein